MLTYKCEKLVWDHPPASATVSIGDPISGNILAFLRSDASQDTVTLDFTADPKLWQDWGIDAFPGGTLYVYGRGC